jgi:hypothetical protein
VKGEPGMRKSLARAVPLAGAFFAVWVSIEIVGAWDLSPGKGQIAEESGIP